MSIGDAGSLLHGDRIDQPIKLTGAVFPDGSIVDRFNAVVRRFPSHLAIQDATVSITYAGLADLVNRIAAATIAATAGRLGPVAVLLPAGANIPAAMLGVLAAGRAYVAIDADSPTERRALIISQAGASAVIMNRAGFTNEPAFLPSELPIIDVDDLSWPEQPVHGLRHHPDDMAAIYYTSGSSGQPKGVALSHRSILHWVQSFTEAAGITCADRMLSVYSASVSASYRSIFGALLNGGSVHILPPLDVGVIALVQQIRARGITVYHSVPALLRRVADSLGPGERLATVRIAHVGGDRVDWSDVNACRRCFSPDVLIFSTLSSTEAGPFLCWFVDDTLQSTTAAPPVGRAASGWRVMIVDDEGQPTPEGNIGNIVVAGRFIALGYWHGPEHRVLAFPGDPADPKGRVFKGADRGRRRPDGLIEFVGRNDQQIKLHGNRIEIDEVELATRKCAGVKDAAIAVRRDEFGVPRAMAAYVEPGPSAEAISPRSLRLRLIKYLPRHMIPATFHVVEQLPRLSNLKIDRIRLAQMDANRVEQIVNTADEPLIGDVIKIFESVLGEVGATSEDNVSSLGGDSLQMVRVAIELENHFGIAIPAEVFESLQTISELAQWVAAHRQLQTMNNDRD